MSNTFVLPINFGSLSLEMAPHFKNKEKLEYVEIKISYAESILYQFDLRDQVEPIDTRKHGEYSTNVKGEMYLDLSKEKIIFEGLYFDEKTPTDGCDFWLEVDPDSKFSKGHDKSAFFTPTIQCPAYPASVGSLQFNIESSAGSSVAATSDMDDQTNITFEIFQLESRLYGKTEELPRTKYLSTILSQGKRITGIDTSNKSKMNLSDFIGDVGFVRNRAYIDGYLKIKDEVCCGFYLEMGV